MSRELTPANVAARNAKARAAWQTETDPAPYAVDKVSLKDIFVTGIPKPAKYRNVKTEVDGITFDSRREAKRWQELKMMEKAGAIKLLTRQVRYTLIPAQERDDGATERGVYYVADFEYSQGMGRVIEDAKGVRTADYILKRKLLLWVHGITIKEV